MVYDQNLEIFVDLENSRYISGSNVRFLSVITQLNRTALVKNEIDISNSPRLSNSEDTFWKSFFLNIQ